MSYYITGLCDNLPAYVCNPCSIENGRIRGVAIIEQSWTFTNPSSQTEWGNGIAAGAIIILPMTHGTYDGGKPKDGPGFGNNMNSYLGSEFNVKFFEPNYATNASFMNGLRKSVNYKIAFITSTQVHMVETPCSFRPMDAVQDDFESTVVWEVDVKWITKDAPLPYTIPTGVFIPCNS